MANHSEAWKGKQINDTVIKSTGASCLHFEAQPDQKDLFKWDRPRYHPDGPKDPAPNGFLDTALQTTEAERSLMRKDASTASIPQSPRLRAICPGNWPANSYVDIPLERKIFLFNGQSTMWPQRHVKTITGTAFLKLENGKLVVYFTMFTQSSIAEADIFEPTGEPVFHVGSVDGRPLSLNQDAAAEKEWPLSEPDKRESEAEKSEKLSLWKNIKGYTLLKNSAMNLLRMGKNHEVESDHGMCVEDADKYSTYTKLVATREDMNNLLQVSYNGGHFVSELDPKALAQIVNYIGLSEMCSGPYLKTGHKIQRRGILELLVWFHFIMEAPKIQLWSCIDRYLMWYTHWDDMPPSIGSDS
eukprot:TRINITY_DN40086_c0_g1_i1.p2 TRINITY_DN40086_c0_g1~~TRINITY_DN40086_c0_g1_i1.p2  ORF type:complete len:357 (-),score=24.76 TRINITY_DN40086_c0_g1_i1:248-1318(-)